MHLGVEDFDLAVALDRAGRDLARSFRLDIRDLRPFAVDLRDQALDIQNDLGHVLFDALDGRELVEDAVDLDRGHRHAGQRGQQDTTQAVADGHAVAAIQRFHDELAVGAVRCQIQRFDTGLFDRYHAKTLLCDRSGGRGTPLP